VRIRAAVVGSAPADPAQAGGKATVSIGAATFAGKEPSSPEALLARVDAALYRAKREGRNRVVLHDA
jgi:diguanylate cyclase (GGDEF)-like protein